MRALLRVESKANFAERITLERGRHPEDRGRRKVKDDERQGELFQGTKR